MMNPESMRRHILIDFENVPSVRLASVVHVAPQITLLVGAKNKNLSADLVADLLAVESKINLVRLTAPGRNALDLTLAFYLGKVATEDPRAEFYVISGDRDYAPMIEHVKLLGIRVSQHASIDSLPFLPTTKAADPINDAPYTQFVEHLRSHPNNRPSRRTTLVRHIQTHFGNRIHADDAEAVITHLCREGHIAVTAQGKIDYRL